MNKTTSILVVEDEAGFERLLCRRLRREIKSGEYIFAFAANGREALEVLETKPDIDIVLSDLNMPLMDGLSLLAELKTAHPELITVIVSAYGDMDRIRAAMNRGAFDFVTKPIDFTDLKATLQKAIQEVELIRQAAKAKELELKNEQLRKLDQMKSQFLTNVSHEFRTPLTVIDGMAEQILKKPEKWLSSGVKMIKRNSARLLHLVNQVITLASLDEGKARLSMVRGDIIGHLRQVAEPFYPQAESRNIRLEFTNGLSELWMDYDPEKVEMVLSNLLSNALKFTPAGGEVHLCVDKGPWPVESQACKEQCLLISVRDTGVGIPEGQLPFIFGRFYQADSSSTRAAEGAGLGLALVKELMELMSGRVSVSSREGEGSTFQLALPIP